MKNSEKILKIASGVRSSRAGKSVEKRGETNSSRIMKVAAARRAALVKKASRDYLTGLVLVRAGRAMMKRADFLRWPPRPKLSGEFNLHHAKPEAWVPDMSGVPDQSRSPDTWFVDQNEHPGIERQVEVPVRNVDSELNVDSLGRELTDEEMLTAVRRLFKQRGIYGNGVTDENGVTLGETHYPILEKAVADEYLARDSEYMADRARKEDERLQRENEEISRAHEAYRNAVANGDTPEAALARIHAERAAGNMSSEPPKAGGQSEGSSGGSGSGAKSGPSLSDLARHPVYTGAGAGAGVGAIAGLLYEALRDKKKDEKGKSYFLKTLLGSILGAGVGGLVGKYAPNQVSAATRRVTGK